LDIGADKDLPYFTIEEENAALGWRGIRFTLDHPEIFSAQMRAMLKASIGLNNLHILFPMITSISEVEESLYLLHRSLHEVQEEEQVKINMPRVGVMIEVPSVLTMIDELAELVDFFSVGSNDLTQYLLAVDRNNPRVAGLYSYFHPAVLRTLNQLVVRCRELDRPISLCGEMAGDPSTAILMMAMGFNSLSMSSSNLLKVRKTIIHTPLSEAQELLSEVLKMNNPAVIRSWVERYLQSKGLGSMVRPGPTNLSTS
jgi:phosphotransferase system enzyme I (PtsP)